MGKKGFAYLANAIVWACAMAGAYFMLGGEYKRIHAMLLILWIVSNGPLNIAFQAASADRGASEPTNDTEGNGNTEEGA
jgi:hypothetical protein